LFSAAYRDAEMPRIAGLPLREVESILIAWP